MTASASTNVTLILARVAVPCLALIAATLVGAAPASAGSPSTTRPALSLPRPTGPYPVGVRSGSVSDPSRIDEQTQKPRRLPIRVWYPALHHRPGPSADYVSPAVQPILESVLGLPSGWLDVDTHATSDARSRPHLAGIVVVQHGGGLLAAFQTGQVIDLASRGYAVVTMEHPHESIVIEEPDGTLILGVEDADTIPFSERILDASVVLDALPRLVPEAGRRTPVAMFGHSRGGAAAAEVMVHHPRVVAGVDLDGSPRGEVVAAGLDQPFGLMLSLQQPLEGNDLLAEFLGNLRGPHPVRELPVLHYGYTDWVVFNPQATRADAAIGAHLEQLVSTGTSEDLRAGQQSLTAQRQFLSRFLARHLAKSAGGQATQKTPLEVTS